VSRNSGAAIGLAPVSLVEGLLMNKFASLALASLAPLALAACGSADSAKEEAQADNVELPAEEAVGDIAATPVADPSAAPGAAAAASDAAAAAPSQAPASPAPAQ
jgi:hypothetical protein